MKQLRKRSRFLTVLLALLLTISVAGCASSPDTTSTAYDSAAPQSVKMESDTASYSLSEKQESPARDDNGFAAADESTLEQTQNSEATSTLNRKIIKTVNMNMETLEFDTLIASLTTKTDEFGGYVQSSSVSGIGVNQRLDDEYSPTRNAYVVVRIPTAKLDEFTTLVGTLGNVTQKDEGSEDITLTYADTEARKETLSVEYERLTALLTQAESLDAVVALEARLSEVRYELDNLGSALRRYDSLVDYSTVSISVQEVHRLTPQKSEPLTIGSRISTGFKETLLDLRDGSGNFAVWFVVNLPYLLIWAVIIAAAVILIRRGIKKRKVKRAAQPAYRPPYVPAPPVSYPPQAPQNDEGNKDDLKE
ncbi:MAG: DUF4349 domain-containing protein [Acetanaerobacterium sp.]